MSFYYQRDLDFSHETPSPYAFVATRRRVDAVDTAFGIGVCYELWRQHVTMLA